MCACAPKQHRTPAYINIKPLGTKPRPPPVVSVVTGVAGLAPHGEVDVALLGRLLHQLHHQLVGLAHHRRAVHADQLIARAQAAVLVRRSVLHYVADIDLGRGAKGGGGYRYTKVNQREGLGTLSGLLLIGKLEITPEVRIDCEEDPWLLWHIPTSLLEVTLKELIWIFLCIF